MTTEQREAAGRNLQGAEPPPAEPSPAEPPHAKPPDAEPPDAEPPSNRGRLRLIRKVEAKASAFAGSAFVAGIAAAFLGAWITTRLATKPPTLTNHALIASIETQRQANDELGVPDFASRARLARLGVAVQARFTVTGLKRQDVINLTCRVYAADAPSGWYKSRSFPIAVSNGTQVSLPCWIALPRSRRARDYNALAFVTGPHWTKAPALLPVSFIAPPTAG